MVRAADGAVEKADPKAAPLLSSKDIGPIPYLVDNESFTDLMGFKGAAPEVGTLHDRNRSGGLIGNCGV